MMRIPLLKHAPLFLVTLLICGLSQAKSSQETQEYVLSNGLKIVVKEDHRAPIAVFQIWYKVGGSYEGPGETGISHALEHMMFQGTPSVPAKHFSKIVAEYGGQENAFTTRDYTAYYQIFEKNRLPISFQLEADRMINANFSEELFNNEIKVVKEERRLRTEDNPNAQLYERFQAAAYVSSTYHQPVVGWMHDLNNLDRAALMRWYKQWYAPNNATIVVVGDADFKDVIALAKKHFGKIPARSIPSANTTQELEAKGTRRVSLKAPAKLPAILMGYNVPSFSTSANYHEVYSLVMLAGILDGGYSARIEKNLIRKDQIASSASAGYSGLARGDTLFTLSARPSKNTSISQLERSLLEEVEKLKSTPAKTEELDRVRAQIIASYTYQQDSISSQARQIGSLESVGLSWKLSEEFVEGISKITAKDIQLVASKYLTTERLTVAQLIPEAFGANKQQEPANETF